MQAKIPLPRRNNAILIFLSLRFNKTPHETVSQFKPSPSGEGGTSVSEAIRVTNEGNITLFSALLYAGSCFEFERSETRN